jgi:hypothetical protein
MQQFLTWYGVRPVDVNHPVWTSHEVWHEPKAYCQSATRLCRQPWCLARKQVLLPDAISFHISNSSRDSSVDIATDLGLEIFLHSTAFEPGLEPTQPPIQRAPRALSSAVKWSRHEANDSSPNVEVKDSGATRILLIPHMSSWRNV